MLEPISFSSPVGKMSARRQGRCDGRDRKERSLSIEVELKLVAPSAELEKVERALLAMPTVRSQARLDLVSTYYDTPTLTLHRARLTLRVRKEGKRFVQTVKTGDFMEANLWERREWEEPIAGNRPDLDARKTRVRLPKAIRKEDLRPVFTTVVARRVVELEPHAATRIEVAIDQGEICTANGGARRADQRDRARGQDRRPGGAV